MRHASREASFVVAKSATPRQLVPMKRAYRIPLVLVLLAVPCSAQTSWTGPNDVGAHGTGIVGTGDFNADGFVDVAYSRNGAFHWYAGPGFDGQRFEIGAGSGNSYGGTCADMNGDGWPDLVASNGAAGSGPGSLWVFLHPGSAAAASTQDWERVTIYTLDVWHQNDLGVADMDGDGRLDVVVRTRTDARRVLVALQNADFNAWTTRFWPTGETANGPEGLALGDVDNDGENEIVLSGVWWDNPGGWRSGDPLSYLIDEAFVGLAVKSVVADLDGDGQADDIVMAKAEGSGANSKLSWYQHDGQPTAGAQAWTETLLQSGVTNMHTVAVADLDGDGDKDILAGKSFGSSGLYAYYGAPGGASWTEQLISASGQSYVTSVVDLDADGDLDFVGPFRWQGAVRLWRNELNGGSSDMEAPTQPTGLQLEGLSSAGATLSWEASSDNVGVTAYRLYVNGVQQQSVPGSVLTTLLGGLPASSLLTLTATAVDAALNESAPSEPLLVVTPPGPDPSGSLLAWWPLDESSGTVAPDLTGFANGAVVGAASWAPTEGVHDGALRFGGGEDRVELGAFDPGSDLAQMTLAAWVKPESFAGNGDEARFLSKATGSSESDHVFMLGNYADGTSLRGRLNAGGAVTTVESPVGQLALNTWTHVAMTYDGAAIRLYRNGVEVASAQASGSVPRETGVSAALGNQPIGAGERGFFGLMDDAVVLTTALSPAELMALSDGNIGGGGGSPLTATCFCSQPSCGNPDPGAGCENSTGSGALLSGAGSRSLATDDLVLTISGLPANTFGLMFMGSAQVGAIPVGAGQRCIGGTLLRWPAAQASPMGTIEYGPGLGAASQSFPSGSGLLVGSTWHFQAWYRDVIGASGATCTEFFNLSSAGTVTFTD